MTVHETTADGDEQPENTDKKLVLQYEGDAYLNGKVRETYWLSDGSLFLKREEWSYNYPKERMERTRENTLDFDLADDGVTVEHDGRHWKRYARERFPVLVAKGPYTGKLTGPDEIELDELDPRTLEPAE